MSTENNNEDKRHGKPITRASLVIETSALLNEVEKQKCLHILQTLEGKRSRFYFPDETAEAIILLVTKTKEPISGSKRARRIYQKVRNEIQEWGVVDQISLERANIEEFSEICIKLDLEPDLIESLVKYYRYVIENVLLGGKTSSYTMAAVLLHSLSEPSCKKVSGTPLLQSQISELCEILNVKQKVLLRYTETLANNCCCDLEDTNASSRPSKRKKTNPSNKTDPGS